MPRVTQHNSRGRKDGTAFSPKHNDRSFKYSEADHIDPSLTSGNLLFNIYDGEYSQSEKESKMSFEEAEMRYYHEHFTPHLDDRNESYKKQAHPEKIKSMEEYFDSERTRPESQIVQVGTKDFSIPVSELQEIVKEQIEWERVTFPQAVILDYALHVDEPNCAPHFQITRVWVAHDEQGFECVGQSAALREMGVDRPHKEKKESKVNNAKVTYTLRCREHLEQLCREHGIELEDRKSRSEVGLEFLDYKCRQAEEKAKAAEERAEAAEARAEALEEKVQTSEAEVKKAEEKIAGLTEKNRELEIKLDHALSIVNNNKISVSPETKKNVRGVVTSIKDLTRREDEIETKEKELAERERAVKNKESKLEKLINKLDPENIIQRIVEALKPIINIFAGDLYERLRKFLHIKRQDKLLEEFDRKYIDESMKTVHIDVKKEIEEAVREADDFGKDGYPFDRDER